MSAEPGIFSRGRFDLPEDQARKLLYQQMTWAGAYLGVGTLLVGGAGVPVLHPLVPAAATGLAVVLTQTRPLARIPLRLLLTMGAVYGASLVLSDDNLLAAAALIGGLAIGKGTLGRIEAGLAGLAASLLALWMHSLIGGLPVDLQDPALLLLMGLATSQVLLPAALRFRAAAVVPSPAQISRTLTQSYRAPCMRAWQLDQEVASAPDPHTREGLAEVGGWVYRLALTLQTLDADIHSIKAEEVAQRRDALLAEAATTEDSFIRDRHQGTARHLDRLLEHRVALQRERDRTASLQDYALAYLEEARAGIALARVLPGERTPEQLGVVLDKLRTHAAESGARRQAARELEVART
jgi:hypothetical protein